MQRSIHPEHDLASLLIIDVQERLVKAMPTEMVQRLLKSHHALLEMAEIFDIPVSYTEQYPRGLGETVEELRGRLEGRTRFEKTEFSACRNADFASTLLETLPRDVILTGMEAHVCVLQTATDLIRGGHRVFVPLDAVASRTQVNRDSGLELLRAVGAVVTNTETLVFERLGEAGGDAFKRISRAVR